MGYPSWPFYLLPVSVWYVWLVSDPVVCCGLWCVHLCTTFNDGIGCVYRLQNGESTPLHITRSVTLSSHIHLFCLSYKRPDNSTHMLIFSKHTQQIPPHTLRRGLYIRVWLCATAAFHLLPCAGLTFAVNILFIVCVWVTTLHCVDLCNILHNFYVCVCLCV